MTSARQDFERFGKCHGTLSLPRTAVSSRRKVIVHCQVQSSYDVKR